MRKIKKFRKFLSRSSRENRLYEKIDLFISTSHDDFLKAHIKISYMPNLAQESILASHLAKSEQDARTYKILQDGRFGKIEQEHLVRSCKYMQDPSYAR
jgi:hypothetical protein